MVPHPLASSTAPKTVLLFRDSMGHHVRNHINRQWISDLFRKVVEIIIILPFALPPVAVVGVVRCEHHQASFVVEDGPVMHFARIPPFPGTMFGIILALRAQP